MANSPAPRHADEATTRGERILTAAEADVAALLRTARTAASKQAALNVLEQARALCASHAQQTNAMPSLQLEVLTDLAEYMDASEQRQLLWRKGIDDSYRNPMSRSDVHFGVHLIRKVVDYTQDPYLQLTDRDVNTSLARAKNLADDLIPAADSDATGQLLTCKASLLRRMSRAQNTRQQEVEFSTQAIRCAEKASEVSAGAWYSILELANCIWHSAQFERNEIAFNQLLQKAETYFQTSVGDDFNRSNALALAQFYRSTYQSMPFVVAYQQYARIEHNKNEYLKGSFMWGEGVLQLYYGDYPPDVVSPLLADADQLLEKAIDSGYGDARHIVSLGFIKATQGDIAAGLQVIKLLHPTGQEISWTEVAERLGQVAEEKSTLLAGLALGITRAGVWNKLGTYARRFLDDPDLAIAMYRVALRLSPSSAVAMTNLASTLARSGSPEALEEAERLISKAASCADRRFRWWRTVRESIELAKSGSAPARQRATQDSPKLRRLADVRRAFEYLEQVEDKQRRGYEFEKVVARLIHLSLGNCRPSYRIQQHWGDGSISQIDAAFCYLDTQFFRVETKWKDDPAKPADIVQFRDKLDVVGLIGLFISVNGFSAEAVAKAASFRDEREIILMDGDELRLTLVGCPSFDEAIRVKRQYLLVASNPYHRIAETVQDEVE